MVGDTDYGSISPPHEYGADRFAANGNIATKPKAQRDGDWRVVRWITSGGYGYSVKASLAQGYEPNELSTREETGLFEIEILGKRQKARINVDPLFDPMGEKMQS